MKVLMIGVCGGSGSGKTTLVNQIVEKIGADKVCTVSMDSFYKYQPNTTYEERCLSNYDHPNSLDLDLMCESINNLKEGKTTTIPVYDFTIHNRDIEKEEVITPKPVIIVDGILLFADPKLMNLFDIKIYVDVAEDIRVLRRLLRDGEERKRTPQSVVSHYMGTVREMHYKYIEPSKKYADIILPNEMYNDKSCELVADMIKYKLEENNI